eukprot:TRINITY_DN2284_c0_g1_i1.p1 TRINITY_DN2284_c0_g1~~TRINITY_DN2284_c0_g1_i1.p1  ORF type:complete len:127 (-),score=26.04 TRINITY_DN2284_c0_g1_i1:40-420(-)
MARLAVFLALLVALVAAQTKPWSITCNDDSCFTVNDLCNDLKKNGTNEDNTIIRCNCLKRKSWCIHRECSTSVIDNFRTTCLQYTTSSVATAGDSYCDVQCSAAFALQPAIALIFVVLAVFGLYVY